MRGRTSVIRLSCGFKPRQLLRVGSDGNVPDRSEMQAKEACRGGRSHLRRRRRRRHRRACQARAHDDISAPAEPRM